MTRFTDALRGYAYPIHVRDGFRCVYCGLDGAQWPNWLFLSQDHLLPPGHPRREEPAYRVTACRFCNEAANRTTYDVQVRSPEEIVAMKKAVIAKVREAYQQFWRDKVEGKGLGE